MSYIKHVQVETSRNPIGTITLAIPISTLSTSITTADFFWESPLVELTVLGETATTPQSNKSVSYKFQKK